MRRLRPLNVALLIPWMVAIVAARLPLRDNSYLWHVRAGTIQIDRGAVLTADPFSFTFGGESWRTQSWLIELLYGWLDRAVGLSHHVWIVAVSAAVFSIAAGLIIWQHSKSLVGSAILLAATSWIMAPFLNPRPVVLSFGLIAAVYLVAEHERLRWVLAPLMWVWASVHASFVLGIALVLVVRIGDRRIRHGVEDGLTMLAVSLFTAHGWGAIDFLVGFVGHREALSYLTEWSTPDFISVSFVPVVGLILLAMIGSSRGRLQFRHLIVALFGLLVLFSASRSVLVGWIILLPLAAGAFESGDDSRLLRGSSTGVGLLGGVLAAALIIIPIVLPIKGGLQEGRFPAGAVDALDHDVPTFHDDVAGGFLAYTAHPDFEIFVDDRAELYGADFFQKLVKARSGSPVWRSVFAEYEIGQALLRGDDELVTVLANEGWRETYSDDHFKILVPDS